MKTRADIDQPKNRLAHLTYSASCLPARDRTTAFLKWIGAAKSAHSLCPVKQKRALLESNPPRDNWIEGDEINRLRIWGAKNSPNANPETFISEPSHALKNFEHTIGPDLDTTKQIDKNTLSRCPFFRSKPIPYPGAAMGGKRR